MGACLHCLTASKTNLTGGAFESLSAAGGDSLSLFAFPAGSRAWLLTAWGIDRQSAAEFDIRSPRLHDNVRGIRLATTGLAPGATTANGAQILLGHNAKQPMYSSDTLIEEVNATAADDAILSQLIYYENLPGIDADLASWQEIAGRIVNLVGIKVAPQGSGTKCSFGATVALNSSDDRLQADLSYALLGYTTTVPFCTLRVRGPNTGNFGVGGPGMVNGFVTANWFVDISNFFGLPLIPIIAANNRGTTSIDLVDTVASVAPTVDLILAELM